MDQGILQIDDFTCTSSMTVGNPKHPTCPESTMDQGTLSIMNQLIGVQGIPSIQRARSRRWIKGLAQQQRLPRWITEPINQRELQHSYTIVEPKEPKLANFFKGFTPSLSQRFSQPCYNGRLKLTKKENSTLLYTTKERKKTKEEKRGVVENGI